MMMILMQVKFAFMFKDCLSNGVQTSNMARKVCGPLCDQMSLVAKHATCGKMQLYQPFILFDLYSVSWLDNIISDLLQGGRGGLDTSRQVSARTIGAIFTCSGE